jgi:hypothetical protein
MARRHAGKAKKSAAAPERPRGGSAKTETTEGALKERLATAERERDGLRADLDRLQERLRAIEKAQAEVCDRIAWALDSLHKILDGKK